MVLGAFNVPGLHAGHGQIPPGFGVRWVQFQHAFIERNCLVVAALIRPLFGALGQPDGLILGSCGFQIEGYGHGILTDVNLERLAEKRELPAGDSLNVGGIRPLGRNRLAVELKQVVERNGDRFQCLLIMTKCPRHGETKPAA